MAKVSISELRVYGGAVVDRAARGGTVTITRAGVPVAELYPLSPRPLTGENLLARWRWLPAVDPVALRADIDDGLQGD